MHIGQFELQRRHTTTMGNSFRKMFDKLFGNREMRVRSSKLCDSLCAQHKSRSK